VDAWRKSDRRLRHPGCRIDPLASAARLTTTSSNDSKPRIVWLVIGTAASVLGEASLAGRRDRVNW